MWFRSSRQTVHSVVPLPTRTQRASETLSAEAKITEAAAAAAISRHPDMAHEARDVWLWEAIKRQKFDRDVALIMVAAPWSGWCAGQRRKFVPHIKVKILV